MSNFMIRNMKLPSEKDIMSTWLGHSKKPLVSISCTTYNHVCFIEDAIRGFLIQKTNFPFEIIIHDDASTDGTQNIISNYENEYPNLIRTIFQTQNQYSRGVKPGEFLFPAYRGKYVANCEGDDFWTDPNKLQIQVSFLEKNPDFVLSSHDAAIIDESGEIISPGKLPESRKRDCTKEELLSGRSWILTLSRVYRREFGRVPESKFIKNGDTFFSVLMGQYGKSKFHNDIKPAMYRVHGGGVWSSVSSSERVDDHINTWFWIYRYFKRVGNSKYASFYYRKAFLKYTEKVPLSIIVIALFRRLIMFNTLKVAMGKLLGIQRARKLRDFVIDLKRKMFKGSSK
jgi:glycosyltransferase involved in cell wall biosynthesis